MTKIVYGIVHVKGALDRKTMDIP